MKSTSATATRLPSSPTTGRTGQGYVFCGRRLMPGITDPHVILIALLMLAWLGLGLSTDRLNRTGAADVAPIPTSAGETPLGANTVSWRWSMSAALPPLVLALLMLDAFRIPHGGVNFTRDEPNDKITGYHGRRRQGAASARRR
jgi:hypothetical protein